MMFSRRRVPGVRTAIAAGTRICGDIEFSGDLLICGRVEGNLRALTQGATLIIARGAVAAGSIIVPRLILSGSVTGRIWVTEHMEITNTAVIRAHIRYDRPANVDAAPAMISKGGGQTSRARIGPMTAKGSEANRKSPTSRS